MSKQSEKSKRKVYERCNACNRKRKPLNESHNICRTCYQSHILYNPSGSEVVDDFIKYTQVNKCEEVGIMEFVSYDQFKDIEFIAEGGFNKIYKATWINGCIKRQNEKKLNFEQSDTGTFALKKLNKSKEIISDELKEV